MRRLRGAGRFCSSAPGAAQPDNRVQPASKLVVRGLPIARRGRGCFETTAKSSPPGFVCHLSQMTSSETIHDLNLNRLLNITTIMKKIISLTSVRPGARLLVGVLAIVLSGCASQKSKPMSERGWIGGEYALSRRASFLTKLSRPPGTGEDLPKSFGERQKTAILVTKLGTNTPASLAGLRKGDIVFEVDKRPVTRLSDFQRRIDRSKPGTSLDVKAFRDGKVLEYNVPVGREKYKKGGWFSIVFPSVVHCWDLWPDPGFSLIMIGFEPNPGVRKELGGDKEAYDEEWSAYLVCFELSYGKRVHAQEQAASAQ
jgi:hypothetical protein